MWKKLLFLSLFLSFFTFGEEITLKSSFNKAEKGDFLVLLQGKMYTYFSIKDKKGALFLIEEISIPAYLASCQEGQKESNSNSFWVTWRRNGAEGNTSWIHYNLNSDTGNINNIYSFTRQSYLNPDEADSFLKTLLNLNLISIPLEERKKVGRKSLSKKEDNRALWNPSLVYEGKVIPSVNFEGYRTTWPKDLSAISEKTIEVYLPEKSSPYPSYFPYWIQVKGLIGPATLRVVDSGKE